MTSNLIQAFAFGIWQSIFLKNTASSEEEWTSVILNAIPQVNKSVSVLESMPVNECLVMWYHDANGWDWDAST